jgi:hypothetical protein
MQVFTIVVCQALSKALRDGGYTDLIDGYAAALGRVREARGLRKAVLGAWC